MGVSSGGVFHFEKDLLPTFWKLCGSFGGGDLGEMVRSSAESSRLGLRLLLSD